MLALGHLLIDEKGGLVEALEDGVLDDQKVGGSAVGGVGAVL